MWREAGADVKGTRVHFPRGLCRSLIKTAPKTFTQHARNPERSGRDRRQRDGLRAGLRPALRARPRQGPPLRHDRGFSQLREARLPWRRPSTIPAAPCASRSTCPSTSGTSTWSIRTSAIPTNPSWARSRIRSARRIPSTMAEMVFGKEFVDENCVMISLINANSPMVFDAHHARRAESLCARGAGDDRHALHPRRRDVAGHRRRHADAGAGRSAGRRGADAALPAGRAGR